MGSLCRLKRGTRDWKRAYRQLPRWMQHAAYHIVCAWHPDRQKWQFAELLGLCFGLLASVLHFNRWPALMVAFFRCWYGLPAINFFDDLEFTLPELACRDGWRAFIAGAQLFSGFSTMRKILP